MAEISYKEFEDHVKSLKGDDFKPVYLIHGEEFLFKSAFDVLLDRMIPKEKRSFGYEPADEDSESMADVIERLNTFSLMPGTKVVSLCESKVFYTRDDNAGLVKKIKAAWDKGEKKKAVAQLGSLLVLADLALDEADSAEGIDALSAAPRRGAGRAPSP
jgi:DNA polymerase-3 subunit delta